MGVIQTGPYSWRITTDEKHIIRVDSILVSNEWEKSAAYAGQKAYFLIYTSFVGYGSPVTVTCRTKSGATVDSFNVKIYNDFHRGFFEVPAHMEEGEQIYFEIFSGPLMFDHASKSIPVFSTPYVENMRWSRYEAERYDILTLSADVYNVQDHTPALLNIYEYDKENAHGIVTKIPVQVAANRIEIMWQYRYSKPLSFLRNRSFLEEQGYEHFPLKYFFTITIGTTEYGKENQDSGFLRLPNEEISEVDLIEFEDLLFHHNSALPLPNGPQKPARFWQKLVRGLDVLENVFSFLKENFVEKPRSILILGHTDSTGSQKYNATLSLYRAQSLYFLLVGDRDGWKNHFEKEQKEGVATYQPQDIQSILNWVSNDFEWECGPLAVDGKIGTLSRNAIKNFKRAYNETFSSNRSWTDCGNLYA